MDNLAPLLKYMYCICHSADNLLSPSLPFSFGHRLPNL